MRERRGEETQREREGGMEGGRGSERGREGGRGSKVGLILPTYVTWHIVYSTYINNSHYLRVLCNVM